MWLFFWILIAVTIHVGLTKLYKRKPPVLIEGPWIILCINVTPAWSTYDDIHAIDTAVICILPLVLLYGIHGILTRAKLAVNQVVVPLLQKDHIDDWSCEQIVKKISQGAIGVGLMILAIVEADFNHNRAQAIYTELSAAPILSERESITSNGQIEKRKEPLTTEPTLNQSTPPTKVTSHQNTPPQLALKYYKPWNESAADVILICMFITFLVVYGLFSQSGERFRWIIKSEA